MKPNLNETYKYIQHTFIRACDTALHLLQKGADFAKEKNMSDAELLESRLASDMFDLKKQFQIFSDNVAGGLARASGMQKPSMPDTETTIAELIARVEKTKEFAKSIDAEKVSGIENLKIKLPWMPEGMYFEGGEYLTKYTVQNTMFHLVTAYDILRHKGLQIGKQDFMGTLEMKKEN